MTARFDLVTVDSPDTVAIARFWTVAAHLHEVEREDLDRWIVLADDDDVRRLGIQRGATRGGSIHFDLTCESATFDDELTRLVGLGAQLLGDARREPYGTIANLADPDGNPFDLCAYV